MLRIHTNKRLQTTHEELPTVALVGARDWRSFMKRLLQGKATIIAELESGNRVHLLDELMPELIIIDVQSSNVNPFEAVVQAKQLFPQPEIVLLGADEPAAVAA